jgi:hypothetical protein
MRQEFSPSEFLQEQRIGQIHHKSKEEKEDILLAGPVDISKWR